MHCQGLRLRIGPVEPKIMNLPIGFGNTVIAGGPKAGKTTLAASYDAGDIDVRHTDDLIETHEWSGASATVAEWFNDAGPWIVEGVAVPRALRKWMAANSGKPCDTAIWMPHAKAERTPGQAAMAKGCQTVWDSIKAELEARGVTILEND